MVDAKNVGDPCGSHLSRQDSESSLLFMTYDIGFQVGLATVVVESAVTSIYICFAEDPVLIQRWDAEFFNKMSEMLHQRLQHRSSRATQVLTSRFDSQTQETAV